MKQLWVGGTDGDIKCVADTYEEVVRCLIEEYSIDENYIVNQVTLGEAVSVGELFGTNWAKVLEALDYETFNRLFEEEIGSIRILPADYIS